MNCNMCGTELGANAAFCSFCGNKIEAGTAVTPAPVSVAESVVEPATGGFTSDGYPVPEATTQPVFQQSEPQSVFQQPEPQPVLQQSEPQQPAYQPLPPMPPYPSAPAAIPPGVPPSKPAKVKKSGGNAIGKILLVLLGIVMFAGGGAGMYFLLSRFF